MTHTQIRLPLSALFLAVASLAGCGGDSNSPPTPGVAKTAQTITFNQPGAVTVGGGTGTLAATSTSSLVVAFASTTTSICTVSGTTLTPVAAGTCHIEASQAGDATYEAATMVAHDITVNPAQGLTPQVITFNSPGTQTVGVSPPALVATSDSSLPVTLTSTTTPVCTVTGSTLALVSGGTCTIDATQAGDSAHAAATKVTVSFAVNPGALPPSTTVVNFQETTSPSLAGFGGAENSTVIVDPTNSANKVVAIVKAAAAATYAGTTLSTCPGVQSVGTIPITSTNSKMTLRVWSPTAGQIRLKVEDSADATHSVETEAAVTTPNAWQTLTFDFKTATTPPTAPVNYTFNYNKATIFPMFGAAGTGTDVTYYFDDLIFLGATYTPSASCPTPPPPPPPATFSNVTFSESPALVLTGFGGGEDSAIIPEPGNVGNSVLRLNRSATAAVYAGVTVTTNESIGLTSARLTMTLRVWAPASGIPVKLKVEGAPSSVETTALTTAGNAWQTLTFNLANPDASTPAYSSASTYKNVTIFPNFGATGASAGAQTYYFDDLTLAP